MKFSFYINLNSDLLALVLLHPELCSVAEHDPMVFILWLSSDFPTLWELSNILFMVFTLQQQTAKDYHVWLFCKSWRLIPSEPCVKSSESGRNLWAESFRERSSILNTSLTRDLSLGMYNFGWENQAGSDSNQGSAPLEAHLYAGYNQP